MKVCDKCKSNKDKLIELVIRKKHYDICDSCLDGIIKIIEADKKRNRNFLDNFKDNLDGLNG